LKSLLNADEKKDTQILAIAVDSKEDLQKMVDRISKEDMVLPDFPFLSDPGHRVIDRYGLLNPQRGGIALPATYVIDKQGIVRWKFVEVDYKIRPSNEQIRAVLKVLP
jgi:mycoredoxin-dependent peroxiredoxin